MYKYLLRPGYGSKELLIELLPKDADEVFLDTLFACLQQINVKVQDICNLWINDEVVFKCDSDFGSFEVSKDIWGFVFIMSSSNQSVIIKIDNILRSSGQFQSENIDYKQYR